MNEHLRKKELQRYFKEILVLSSERAVADMVVNSIQGDKVAFDALLSICFEEPYPMCMRASRALQLYCEQDIELLIPDIERIMQISLNSEVEGVRRNFLKIFNEFIDFSLIRDSGYLLDKCFAFVMNVQEKPGIRVHSLQLLCKFALNEAVIARELLDVLDLLEEEHTPSMLSVRRKVKTRLQKLSA